MQPAGVLDSWRRTAQGGFLMIYTIDHLTRYVYTRPVFQEPHTLRLRPLSNGHQQLLDYKIEIFPVPAGQTETVDVEGNSEIRCWFNGLTPELSVRTRSRVSTKRSDPFDYLFLGQNTLPYSYAMDTAPSIEAYRGGDIDRTVREFALDVAHKAGNQTLAFLPALTTTVQQQCRQIYRAEGPPQPSALTLSSGEGSCRDTAVVFIEACRAVGLAARFVSGYYAGVPNDNGDLHAWAEVYIEGGGWRGFDPTAGLAVSDEHIVLAAAARSQDASPASGTFRGRAAVELITSIQIGPGQPDE